MRPLDLPVGRSTILHVLELVCRDEQSDVVYGTSQRANTINCDRNLVVRCPSFALRGGLSTCLAQLSLLVHFGIACDLTYDLIKYVQWSRMIQW